MEQARFLRRGGRTAFELRAWRTAAVDLPEQGCCNHDWNTKTRRLDGRARPAGPVK